MFSSTFPSSVKVRMNPNGLATSSALLTVCSPFSVLPAKYCAIEEMINEVTRRAPWLFLSAEEIKDEAGQTLMDTAIKVFKND